ncbi:MAG: hypothetical protein EBR59_09785 [Methylococcaceae bacterium]|nr:hypothetical protein [Methylococcaceae bacterium]
MRENKEHAPYDLKRAVTKKMSRGNNEFDQHGQNDARECLIFIIDAIHEEVKCDVDVNHTELSEEQKKHLKKYKIYVSIQADKEISKDIKRNVLCQYFDYSRDKIFYGFGEKLFLNPLNGNGSAHRRLSISIAHKKRPARKRVFVV